MTKIIGFQDNQAKTERDNRGKVSPNDIVVLETAEGKKELKVGEFIRGKIDEFVPMGDSTQRAKDLLKYSGLPLAKSLSYWFSARLKSELLFAQENGVKTFNKSPAKSKEKNQKGPPVPVKQITLKFSRNTIPPTLVYGNPAKAVTQTLSFLQHGYPALRGRATLTLYSDGKVHMVSTLDPNQSWTFDVKELEKRGYDPLGKKTKVEFKSIPSTPKPDTSPPEAPKKAKAPDEVKEVLKKIVKTLPKRDIKPFEMLYDLTISKAAVEFLWMKLAGYEGLLPPVKKSTPAMAQKTIPSKPQG